MTVLGVVFRPHLPPERILGMARAAEDAGLEQLWFWEDCFFEGAIATVSAALAWTHRLHVGIGVVPLPMRNVAMTTMETATLHRLFPGRVTLGFGHGNQDWMAQAGVRVESPITLMREHLVAMRALMRGERLTSDGRYVKLDDVALVWPPSTPPEMLIGAIGPRSLRLSGELADGTILSASASPDVVRRARKLIDEGRTTGGRTQHHKVVVYLLTAIGADGAGRVRAEFEEWGDDPTGLGVAGDADTIAEAVRQLADAGADTVVVQPTADEPDPEGFVRFVAEEIRPLVPMR